MQKGVLALLVCFVALSGNAQKGLKKGSKSSKKMQLQNEVIFFMKFTDQIGSREMRKRSIYSVTKYEIDKVVHYKISKDEFYRKDYITISDENLKSSNKTIKKKLKGFKHINNKLICLYGHKNLFDITKKNKMSDRFYSIKNEELSEDYQSFSVTLKMNDRGYFDIKRIYMSYDDSDRYARFRQKKMKRYIARVNRN